MSSFQHNTSHQQHPKETTHWMRYENKNSFEAQDNIASNLFSLGGYSYRNVHYTDQVEQNKTLFGLGKDKVFFDPEWDVRKSEDLTQLASLGKDNNKNHVNDKVIFRRLSHIYPTNQLRPRFFPKDNYNEPLIKVTDPEHVPHALHEMGLFPASHYKSLFFVQDFQNSGMYHAVVNQNGRWQTDVVDDFIPIYENSGKPIWGMDLEQPWQLILMKFWAKRLWVQAKEFGLDHSTGGYIGAFNAAPFTFVNTFSNANWKYNNLQIDSDKFFRHNVNKVHKGHFILKTKNTGAVRDAGLVQNEAAYELVSLIEQGEAHNTHSGIRGDGKSTLTSGGLKKSQIGGTSQTKGHRNYIATLRSCNKNKWTGHKSIIDKDFKHSHQQILTQHQHNSKVKQDKTVYDQNSQRFGVDRYLTMEGKDLVNLFACCYVTPRRLGSDYYSNFFRFTVPANQKKAVYVQFNMPADGFLDFSIKQSLGNKIAPDQKSKLALQHHQKQHGEKKSNQKLARFLKCKYILLKDNHNSDKSDTQTEFERDYNPLHYETYEIQYLKGYNTGDAHFLRAVRGRYILRIKSQLLSRNAEYIINYTCQHDIKMKIIQPTPEVQSRMLRDAMSSTMDRVQRVNLKHGDDSEIIGYGNIFEYVGYGYVGAKLKKTSKSNLLIDVDPAQLLKEGFKLKHQYKNETQPFAVIVRPGQATSIPLKKVHPGELVSHWPPRGIGIFQK